MLQQRGSLSMFPFESSNDAFEFPVSAPLGQIVVELFNLFEGVLVCRDEVRQALMRKVFFVFG